MKIVAPDAEGIRAAVEVLRAGEVVAYPTETTYGLAVDPTRPTALERLYVCKQRPEANPVLVVVGNRQQLTTVARESSVVAELLMDCFWPGPLSLLMPARAHLPAALTADTDFVCVRWTAHPVAQELCRAFGAPVTSTSANVSGRPPAKSLEALKLNGVTLAIDGGELPPGPPSTIFDPWNCRMIREGEIKEELIRLVLGL